MDNTKDILFTVNKGNGGDIGTIIINRPKALNALTPDMFIAVREHLAQWEKDDSIKAVIIKSNDERAFCAGGDIRYLYEHHVEALQQEKNFFWHEYHMNADIFHFKKPYIAFLNGITMGGGVGISLHGKFRIGAEDLKLAMPETGIGFFPDIAAGYFLSRCPANIGMYLGLTGNAINASDAYQLGLIDAIIPKEHFLLIEQALLNMPFNADNANACVEQIIEDAAIAPSHCDVCLHQEFINEYFAGNNIQTIITHLEQSANAWCHTVADTLKTRAPLSLAVTLAHLRRCESMSFDDIIEADFHIAYAFLENHDFGEGIRAMVIDKDKNPQWLPAKLDKINDELIATYFKKCAFSFSE